MQGGTRASFTPAARAEDLGAPPSCELSADGTEPHVGGDGCHHAGRIRPAACHFSGAGVGCASTSGAGCGAKGSCCCSSARGGELERPVRLKFSRAEVSSQRATRSPPWHLGPLGAGGGIDAAESRRVGEPMAGVLSAACDSAGRPPCAADGLPVTVCHPACRAPWHPQDRRCLVPCAGPEERAGWAQWKLVGSGAAPGRAPGSARAIRLAQTHTVCCACCGDLVPLQKARKAARVAGRDCLGAADGCYGCGRHGRKARRAQRQGTMALAILAGRRVLLERPGSAGPRVELWTLPRATAEARARRILATYQPQGLGRWLTRSCRSGARLPALLPSPSPLPPSPLA